MQVNNKGLWIGSIVATAILFSFVGAGLFWLIDSKNDNDIDKEEISVVNDDEIDEADGQTDKGEVNDDTDNKADQNTQPDDPQGSEDEEADSVNYVSKRYECSGYASAGSEKIAYMVLVYPDFVDIEEDSNPNTDCTLAMKYKGAELYVTYTVGEAFPQNLDTDYVTIKEEDGITLVRNPLSLTQSGATGEDIYLTSYIKLLDDSQCKPTGLSTSIRPPCGLGSNPFVTDLGLFYLEIPKNTSSAERQDILDVFDEVAARSYGGKY